MAATERVVPSALARSAVLGVSIWQRVVMPHFPSCNLDMPTSTMRTSVITSALAFTAAMPRSTAPVLNPTALAISGSPSARTMRQMT